ncbi:MAG: hypothetical protein GX638_04725 [Crenarchaeota archaeon]|nr:hypothetical protein [Thermoproteota archaeon]
MYAKIKLNYAELKTATAVIKAISPDNVIVPKGLKIKTIQNGTAITTEITLEGKLSTFIATIDDLLESASTAEKALYVIQKK